VRLVATFIAAWLGGVVAFWLIDNAQGIPNEGVWTLMNTLAGTSPTLLVAMVGLMLPIRWMSRRVRVYRRVLLPVGALGWSLVLVWGAEFTFPIAAFVISGDQRVLAAGATVAFHSREFAGLLGLYGTTGLLFGAGLSLFETPRLAGQDRPA